MKVWVWVILYTFIRSWTLFTRSQTLLHDPEHSHTISSQTLINVFFLTHSNTKQFLHTNVAINVPTSTMACPLNVLNYLSVYKYYRKMNRTVKYVITSRTPRLLQKKLFFLSNIRMSEKNVNFGDKKKTKKVIFTKTKT